MDVVKKMVPQVIGRGIEGLGLATGILLTRGKKKTCVIYCTKTQCGSVRTTEKLALSITQFMVPVPVLM